MASRKDDPFEPKLAPPRGRGSAAPRFLSRVLKAVSQAGPVGRRGNRGGHGAIRGRGFVAAKMASQRMGLSSRRVTVKTRLVNLRKLGAKSSSTHLRYLEREGVTPAGEPGQAYGAVTDEADIQEFHRRGLKDRHQFRIIVSAEEGAELGDLKSFTRAFMARMETDLGTRLEWVAVDHWDTGHPHTHIVLRGREQGGENLVIAREYISRGMRARASEIATEWLGPRTQREIEASLTREVTQERWTSLDASIQRESSAGQIDVSAISLDPEEPISRSLMVGRLNHLAKMGLARETRPGLWSVSPDASEKLRLMGERGDIIRTMQRALNRDPSAYRIFDPSQATESLTGRIAGKGLHGEMHAQGYVIVDGLDGRAHYAALAVDVDIATLPMGAIVQVRGAAIRPSDRTILATANQGIYRSDDHLRALRGDSQARNANAVVQAHVRRLEALRRGGVVERLSDGVWKVPGDLLKRGRAYDLKRLGGAMIDVRCHLALEQQTKAIGATWLDQQLVKGATQWPNSEFGLDIRQALTAREDFLVDQGLARRVNARVILTQNLLATLRDREIAETANRIEATTQLQHRPALDGVRVSGTYRESIQLTSGRFAMLDDGVGFSLVPWHPVIEQRLGRPMSAIVDGSRVNWELGRSRLRSL
jgi:type IV secretory pathway VirD2 relaxase